MLKNLGFLPRAKIFLNQKMSYHMIFVLHIVNVSFMMFICQFLYRVHGKTADKESSRMYALCILMRNPRKIQAFFTWWKKHYHYPGSPANNIKVRLRPKTNRTLQSFLIRKKPLRNILRKME